MAVRRNFHINGNGSDRVMQRGRGKDNSKLLKEQKKIKQEHLFVLLGFPFQRRNQTLLGFPRPSNAAAQPRAKAPTATEIAPTRRIRRERFGGRGVRPYVEAQLARMAATVAEGVVRRLAAAGEGFSKLISLG
ncbi:uncharacterized protein [Gossypium hirsutum]|uniref:Uncharacterized protein n=1 Tax=Gossypium hirsutum TaxID=3635 RepID=A0A1U8KGX9_GOSHI|nr:uncharacterized protein LOC107915576 [Gossypium hirsutum]